MAGRMRSAIFSSGGVMGTQRAPLSVISMKPMGR